MLESKSSIAPQEKILVVDDDIAIQESLSLILEDDYEVTCVESGPKSLEAIKHHTFDLVLLDVMMEEMDGLETLRRIKFEDSDLDVIMVSAMNSVEKAIESLRLGAYDYITKPFDDDIILNRVEKVLLKRRLSKQVDFHNSQILSQFIQNQIISQSKKMTAVFNIIEKVTDTPSNVLITGESGTGKELIAKALHHGSSRKEHPFVAINCAAVPSELIESELFGHEKGAFTGAHKQVKGKFEFANQGTVFLDEVSSLNLSFQAKLLRFIQEREFTRVGSHKTIHVDIRIVAASNTRLDEMVQKGTFREDLYFRLNVVPITLPPLRERKGDVSLLADFFLEKFNADMGKQIKGFSPDAIAVLESHLWPGNVRELENLIERMVVLGSDHSFIGENDIPIEILFPTQSTEPITLNNKKKIGLIPARHSFERRYILRALENCKWNQTLAADLLDIHRNTLIQKMKALDLSRR